MPIRWIQFEQEINKLVSQGTNYASYDQVSRFLAKSAGLADNLPLLQVQQNFSVFFFILYILIFTHKQQTAFENIVGKG